MSTRMNIILPHEYQAYLLTKHDIPVHYFIEGDGCYTGKNTVVDALDLLTF